MEFDILKIDKCNNEECGQVFNEDNIKLVVVLYGVILLTQNAGNEDEDPMGYVGVTCPRCLRTSLYIGTAKDVGTFKNSLLQPIELRKTMDSDKNANIEPKNIVQMPSLLKYYSPFDPKIDEQNEIEYQGFDDPEYEYFSDELQVHTWEDAHLDLNSRFCSYVWDRNHRPVGSYSVVCWLNEDTILTNLDRTFLPRYHHFSELMQKIDALLKYHYFSGKPMDQAKIEARQLDQSFLENFEKWADENEISHKDYKDKVKVFQQKHLENRVEAKQKEINDTFMKTTAEFLEVLLLEPNFTPAFSNETHKYPDYMWLETDPFRNKDLPIDFMMDIDKEDLHDRCDQIWRQHSIMVELVKKNYFKQYVQEFLRDNLVDFLEEYEELVKGNQFSYAHVWRLKENLLAKLYEVTSIQTKQEIPYSMGLAGEIWIIKFEDEKARFYPNEIGFLWIYNILKNPAKPVYYSWLEDTFGKKALDATEHGLETLTGEDNTSDNDENDLFDKEIIDGMIFGDRLTTTYSGIVSEQRYVDDATLRQLQTIVDGKIKAREQSRSKGDSTGYQHHEDGLNALLNYLDREIGVFAKKCKPEEGFIKLQARKFKDDRYKKSATRIKKNYADAMKKIRENDPALHQHFVDHIKKQGGAFIYTPPEDIVWHLD